MDLIAWLEDLAAAYRIEPSEGTARRYLKSLERWRLAPDQWGQLGDRAVLRFARFPNIAELYEIAHEVKLEAGIRANSEWLAKVREQWERGKGGEEPGDPAHSGQLRPQ
jgi:hypothetical protein